jgi:hypothetical protein
MECTISLTKDNDSCTAGRSTLKWHLYHEMALSLLEMVSKLNSEVHQLKKWQCNLEDPVTGPHMCQWLRRDLASSAEANNCRSTIQGCSVLVVSFPSLLVYKYIFYN